MSAAASVTFPFHGTEQEFARLYDAIADIDLDVAAYFKGTMGVVEFMTDDFANFRDRFKNRIDVLRRWAGVINQTHHRTAIKRNFAFDIHQTKFVISSARYFVISSEVIVHFPLIISLAIV